MANETGIHRDKPWTFDVYSKDAGGYAGVALKFIEIAASGGMGTMILCAPNGNAIEASSRPILSKLPAISPARAASRTISRTFRGATSK